MSCHCLVCNRCIVSFKAMPSVNGDVVCWVNSKSRGAFFNQ